MPNCPICSQQLSMTPRGSECDRCRKHFSVEDTVNLPGFDEEIASIAYDALKLIKQLPGVPPGTEFELYFTNFGFVISERNPRL